MNIESYDYDSYKSFVSVVNICENKNKSKVLNQPFCYDIKTSCSDRYAILFRLF